MKHKKIAAVLFVVLAAMLSLNLSAWAADKRSDPEVDSVYLTDQWGNYAGILNKDVKVGDKVSFAMKVIQTNGNSSVTVYIKKQKGLEINTVNSVSVCQKSSGATVNKYWQTTTYTDSVEGEMTCYSMTITSSDGVMSGSELSIPFVIEIQDGVALNQELGQTIFIEYPDPNDSSTTLKSEFDYDGDMSNNSKIRVLGFYLQVTDEGNTPLSGIGFQLTKGEGTEEDPFYYYKAGVAGRFQTEENSTVSTDDKGQFVFDSLEAGTTYTLSNTTADGYIPRASSVSIVVDSSGNITFDGSVDTANTLNLQLAHKPLLPATGGSGRLVLSIIGCVCIALSVVMFCFRKKFFSK